MENIKNRDKYIYRKYVWENLELNEVNYVLSDRTLRIIQKLTKKVSCPTYVKTPTFKYTKRKKNRSENTGKYLKHTDVYKLEDVQHIPQIRSLLNKFTSKTLIPITDEIIMKLELIDKNGKHEVVDSIFSIASCNKFYSEQYAYIYVQIEKKYPYIRTLLENSIDNIVANVIKCKDIEPNENYDLFCDMNKMNDKNRAFVYFIHCVIFLEKEEKLQKMLNVTLDKLIDIFQVNMNNPDCINICNEISELLYISFQQYSTKNKCKSTYIDSVKIKIKQLTNINRKLYVSYTSKAYFRLQDILDILI